VKKPNILTAILITMYLFSFSQYDEVDTCKLIIKENIIGKGETETWFDKRQLRNVRIEEGGTLIIEGRVAMPEGAKIIVERGGKLIIDGGTITNACSGLWKGIELRGTASAGQNPTDQGWVQVINGGTVENAEYAIRTIRADDDINGDGEILDLAYTGGIIHATDAHFINNQTAVKFYSYSHSSYSSFTDCEFLTDDYYIGDTYPECFMNITRMWSIPITNCDFKNEAEGNDLQKGIINTDSYIVIKGTCLEGEPCTDWDYGLFENLHYGIYATSFTPTRYIDVSHTLFDNNFRGIYISGMTNAVVTDNNFSINSPFSPNDGGYGLYLDRSTAYKVEENHFYHEVHSQMGVGLIVNQSGGDPNRIYRNYFTFLECGMDIQGENRTNDGIGLELKCNRYDQTIMDKIITWDGPIITSQAGIATNQGSSSSNPEDMAGNLFQIEDENPNGDFDDILNEANHITYYWPINNNDIRVKPVDYTANVTPKEKEVEPDDWTFENGCPPSEEPGGGGGGIGDTRDKMASAGLKIDSTENLLTLLIDGGNTDATQTEVDNSIPPETMQVYNDLMNKSPYLSDTVISTAIEKEDVLPGAMIRDIMVANPKAAKSEKLMQKLDERWNLLPEYMKAQILQGRSIVSIREETESRLAAFKLERAKHFNTMVRYYLTDTVNPSASFDSLDILLQNENSLNAKYKLAMLKANQEAWSEGLSVLNNIPVQFELTTAEAEAHSQITSYYTLLAGVAQQNKSVFEADSNQIAMLIDMEASQVGKASVYARNILLALDQIEYEEPIILPDLLKSAEAMYEYKELLKKVNNAPEYIKVQPNPAKDYIIVEYELEQEANLTVEINDISGILKYSKNTTGKQDQHIVDTRNWNAGIYIVSLKINGKLIESVKFTIID